VRLTHLTVRGYRNLADLDVAIPASGLALLGPNGHGKTNLLEAVAYPVLFRSFRGAADGDVAAFGGPGFVVESTVAALAGETTLRATWRRGKAKALLLDGAPVERLAQAAGSWLAVTFLPDDTALASGGASVRRAYLDRMLALADPRTLRALSRYRAAVSQRNAALRRKDSASARAFEGPMAQAGAAIVQARLDWIAAYGETLAAELSGLGEFGTPALAYEGHAELADAAAWPAAIDATRAGDEARGTTGRGPHRDDLTLLLNGRPLRSFGSTGQQRSAAIALRLTELETLRAARHDEPGLILDDVFAELDGERQQRLATRLMAGGERQVFISAPRAAELPAALALPIWRVAHGTVTS